MSTFAICAKRLLMDVNDAQSIPKAKIQNETVYAILADSQDYLQRKIKSEFEDGIPARVAIMRPSFNCNSAAECSTPLCEKTPEDNGKPRWETFDVDDCVSSNAKKITVSDYELACNGTLSDAVTNAVMDAIDELKRAFNTDARTFLAANAGNWTDGAATKVVPISSSTTGEGLYLQWSEIQRQFAYVGITTKPNIMGGAPIYALKKIFGIENPNTGFSPELSGSVSMYYEASLDDPAASPANQLFAWSPQTVQVVTYNKFLQDFAQGPGVRKISDVLKVWKSAVIRSTGVIPVNFYSADRVNNPNPITVWADFEMIPDNCGNFKFDLKINYKFVSVITDMCDESGFNGILTMTTCPIATVTCPDAPDPVVPTIYCMGWSEEPCEDPYEVWSVTLGSHNYAGIPMMYDGALATMVTIINTLVGKDIVYLEGGVIKTLLPLASGSLNEGNYPFTFTECPES